jgi:hypothetical protein
MLINLTKYARLSSNAKHEKKNFTIGKDDNSDSEEGKIYVTAWILIISYR